ncbi:cytochrome c biogenesis protein CcsA [Desulfobulbus sp.]|uniref:cytochrome c biogenesis protein CcsA n=1 Tax=Desulfobulbus sp. TaxID=895 RepID=UPI00286F4264|nr:cytochrome c biogenesis protein CcsA [Desulfobulbus sp.]
MAITTHSLFLLAGALYGLALLTALAPDRRGRGPWAGMFLASGLAVNLAVVAWRYHQAWPMLPMHLGAVALPFCLGLLVPFAAGKAETYMALTVRRILLAQIVLLVGAALCFPKDFYLPFLKSRTLLAHGFLWFGLAGKGCFAVSAAWALAALPLFRHAIDNRQAAVAAMHRCQRWAALGFALWTLSMFAGELWSYLGWGTPVVWEDPALTLTMAAWFFYAGLLHLHLTRLWSLKSRVLYASLGGLVLLSLTCVPDFGPFRAPF